MKKVDNEGLIDAVGKSLEVNEKMANGVAPIIAQQQNLRVCVSPIIEQSEKIESLIVPAMPKLMPIVENPAIKGLESVITGFGELAMRMKYPDYSFQSSILRSFDSIGNTILNISNTLNTLVESSFVKSMESVSSVIGRWLYTIDVTPLIKIFEGIQELGFEYDYNDVSEIYLKTMFDARWFPYAGWIGDCKIVEELLEILDTSRKSKNRTKRIDKLVFSYYNKEVLNDLKRGWRKRNLPSYMIRILVQSVQAYMRREYALTISALVTLWEGIIQEKANDHSYRVSNKTRDNLKRLIEENKLDCIFSSFCDEFILYQCHAPEEVKADVPGRHAIAHCWYDKYPNRKVALNAIIFTDFLLKLEPLDQTNKQ